MEKLYEFWNGITGEEADPKQLRKVYIALAVFGVIVLMLAL